MRILHLTDRLTDRGGAYRHLLGIVAWLTGHGHEVALAGGTNDGAAFAAGLHLTPGLEAREACPVDLDALVAEVRPDVVHIHTVVNPFVLEWARDRRAVVTVQDHRYLCPARGKWHRDGSICRQAMSADPCAACFDADDYFREIFALTERRLAALRPLRVVVLSRYMARELAALGVSASVIPPFVCDLDQRATADGPPCVLFVGRLAEHKGVPDAVDIWRRSNLDLPLVMAGTGPMRRSLEAMGVTVLGWLDRPALSRAYRRARALLMPSRWQEPFGIAGLEALAMGVPVVAWDSGGIAEWHPGPLPPWGDTDALAAMLQSAVSRRAAPPIGFEPDALMENLLDVYRAVASRG